MTLVDNLVLQKQHEQLGLEVPNIYFSGSLKTCYGCHEHGWRRSDFKEKKKKIWLQEKQLETSPGLRRKHPVLSQVFLNLSSGVTQTAVGWWLPWWL